MKGLSFPLEYTEPKIQGVSVGVRPSDRGGLEVRAKFVTYAVEFISEEELLHAREGLLPMMISDRAETAARAAVEHAALVASTIVRRRSLIQIGRGLNCGDRRGTVVMTNRRGDVSRCSIRWNDGTETSHAIEDVLDGLEVGAWTVD